MNILCIIIIIIIINIWLMNDIVIELVSSTGYH